MKNRIVSCLLVLAVLTITIVPFATASQIVKFVYTRNGKPLNVRAWPSISSTKLGTIAYGKAVPVENYTADGTWAVITFNGQTAYVMTQYLIDTIPQSYEPTPITPVPTPVPYSGRGSSDIISTMENEFRTYRVVSPYTVLAKPVRASGWVNLRYVPSTEFGHADNLYANAQLTVIAETQNWLQVRNNATGVTGYVMRQYTINMGVGSVN